MTKRPKNITDTVSTAGAAHIIGCTEGTIRRWDRLKILPSTRDHGNRRVFRVADVNTRRAEYEAERNSAR